MNIFNILKTTFPFVDCKLYKEQELADPTLVKEFRGILQEASNELILEFGGGVSHSLYSEVLDGFDVSRARLEGYNVIGIDNQRYEIIRVQKVGYKEGGHLEFTINKNAN